MHRLGERQSSGRRAGTAMSGTSLIAANPLEERAPECLNCNRRRLWNGKDEETVSNVTVVADVNEETEF